MAFQTWMLNGRPGNIEEQVKQVIAVARTRFGLVVTSTSTGPHTWTSYHFPRNNPRRNGLGRGVDLAGTWAAMCRFYYWTQAHRSAFDESFGPPNNHFIKRGGLYSGAIPGHFNHNHVAPKYGARFVVKAKPRVLKTGSTGARVRKLQRILRRKGFKGVPVTGYFGFRTKRAVKRFQRKHHLHADGRVGPKTWKALT